MNPTMYDPITLETWFSDDNNSILLRNELEYYLNNYLSCFRTESQRKLFQIFIHGFLSPLERKSIEPIALHFSDECSVRSMQQFLSRSPFHEQVLREVYLDLLSSQIGAGNGMLSVDDTCFVKKGTHSAGVKRQYCGHLGKTKNCQTGVFVAYAGDKGYGLVDSELYIPKEWFSEAYAPLRHECHIPENKYFMTKNEIAMQMLNQVVDRGLFKTKWIGCDVTYGNDHSFLDGLELPEGTWYFATTNSKEQVFLEYPNSIFPETKRGCPRKHPLPSCNPVSVQDIAQDSEYPWETIVLVEGAKEPITAQRKCVRCFSSRKDGNHNYRKSGGEIWLYLRKYSDGEIKYFISNAPATLSIQELDRAATLRWSIEQCFQECKSTLGMGHYECRSYQGWNRHMLFIMIAHLFTTQIRDKFKKNNSIDLCR